MNTDSPKFIDEMFKGYHYSTEVKGRTCIIKIPFIRKRHAEGLCRDLKGELI